MMPHLGVLAQVHPQAALEVFERVMGGLTLGARHLTCLLDNGSLQRYVALMLISTLVLVVYALSIAPLTKPLRANGARGARRQHRVATAS